MNRKLLYGSVAGGLALLVALVAAVPLLVPTTSLRGEIEARVSRATGRVFKIHGPLAVSLFPSIGLDAQDVTLSNVPGGKARDMVQVKRMRIAVRLWPLFSGRVEAREIALESPRIAPRSRARRQRELGTDRRPRHRRRPGRPVAHDVRRRHDPGRRRRL